MTDPQTPATEAVALDVQRLAEACETTPLVYFEVQGIGGWIEASPDWETYAKDVAAEYARLSEKAR